jgi:hypothetical protein
MGKMKYTMPAGPTWLEFLLEVKRDEVMTRGYNLGLLILESNNKFFIRIIQFFAHYH